MADSDPQGNGAASGAPAIGPNDSSDRPMPGAPSFEQALASLEALVARLESGELPLEAALAAFEEGVALTRACTERLDGAERRIAELVKTPNGLATRPLAVAEGDE
jgi:exodeoxyribonuclease VII small subunit